MENRDQRDFTGDSSLLYTPLPPSHYHHNHHHNPPASAALPFLNYLPRYSAAQPDFSFGFLPAVHLRHICSNATSDSAQVTRACRCSCSSNQTTTVWAEGSHRGAATLSLISRQLFLHGEWKQLERTLDLQSTFSQDVLNTLTLYDICSFISQQLSLTKAWSCVLQQTNASVHSVTINCWS